MSLVAEDCVKHIDQLIAMLNSENSSREQRMAIMLRIKRLRRQSNLELHAASEQALLRKQEAEHAFLHNQNLLYQQAQLQKDITIARSAEPKEHAVDLMTMEECLSKYPDAIDDDSHRTHMNILSHELSERREFVAQINSLRQKKEDLKSEVADEESFLNSIRNHLESILDSADPLRLHLGLVAPE